MPAFSGATPDNGGHSDVPVKNHRYQIPRYPLDGPMPADAKPIEGTGMLQPWTRVSTILDVHKDKEGIFKWTKRLVVKGLGSRPDLYALAAAARVDDRGTLDDVAGQAFEFAKGKASSNMGTAYHTFLERKVRGELELEDIPEPFRSDIAGALAALDAAGVRIRPDLQEKVVVRPDRKDGDAAGMAGRFDLIVELWNAETQTWELVMADYKTGSDPLLYGAWEIQQQLGVYTTAWAIYDGRFWHPMIQVRKDKVLMIHVKPGEATATVSEVDVDPEELEADLDAAYRTRARRKATKGCHRLLGTGTPADPLEGQDSPTEHPDTVPQTAQMKADAETAQRRLAIVRDTPPAAGPVFTDEPAPKAKRTCSVCGQPGHRKGSEKCQGAPSSPDADAVPAGDLEANGDKAPIQHAHKDWTRDALTGEWVCGICGDPAAEPVQGELTAAQAGQAERLTAGAGVQDGDVDPFEDEAEELAPAAAPTWEERLSAAQSKADIRAIREEAKEAGVWNGDLLQHAMKQLDRIG